MLAVRGEPLLRLQNQNSAAALNPEIPMSAIDPATVITLTSIMSGLMSLVLYSLKRNYPASIKGLSEWSAALLIIFCGGLLTTGRGALPDFVSIACSDLLIWSGLYLTYVGTQRFFGVTPRVAPWMILITAALGVETWFTLVEPSYHVRLVLFNALLTYLFGMHAWLVLKQGSITFSKLLAIGVLLGMSAIQIMRVATSFIFPVTADVFDTAPHNLIFVTAFTFSVLLFSISLVLLATDRLRIELEHLANHDSLTDALTRRHMNEACRAELERCRRHGRSMALLMMDLDHFKTVNDTHGHQAGDRVLINFVAQVRALLRGPDQLGRFGGEEFMALLPETSREEAIHVAERIRELCARAGHDPSCTVSIGITTNQKDNDSVDTLLARADAAMYRAKAKGRNRVETS
jgi:diguanylate cyclase (GGDEF)-like protein